MKVKKVSPQALIALEDALSTIFHKKEDLKRYIEHAIDNSPIIATIDWQGNFKRTSVKELLDRLYANPVVYETCLFKLLEYTSNFDDFSHLKYWDADGKMTRNAQEAIKKLRGQTKGYFERVVEEQEAEERRKKQLASLQNKISKSDKLENLKLSFYGLISESNHQRRGYKLEKLLTELFELFDLSPKGPFKITGEQIDGSFTFEHTDFLLEAKWQADQICASDIYAFSGKIEGKHKLTMGLFVSLNGFSKDCIKAIKNHVRCMLLMNGEDLIQVLEGRITLPELLLLKRRHAADTGEIYRPLNSV
jgi:hypothetical protein